MKLKKIYIKSFGRLKNFSLTLRPDMNIIYGVNESGKTTVMNFIKMMFYGSSSKSSDISKNPRKKYAPWDGSMMSGIIEFESLGTNYRLEREFGSSNLNDNITLWNLDTGISEPISCKYDAGERFFGLGAAAFERSVFISGMSSVIQDSDKNDEISKRLMNFATSCDETVSFEIIKKRLKKASEELHSKSGRTGNLDKQIAALSDKAEELAEAEETENKKSSDEELHTSFCEHLKKKQEYYKIISENIKEQHIIRELHSLEVQNRKNLAKDELVQKMNELNKKISNGKFTLTDSFLNECSSMISKHNLLKEKYSEKKFEFNNLSNEISKLNLPEKIQNNYLDLDSLSDKKTELKKEKAEKEDIFKEISDSVSDLNEKLKETHLKEELYKEHLADMESHNNSILINYMIPVVSILVCFIALLVRNAWILCAILPSAALLFAAAKSYQKFGGVKSKKNSAPPDYEKAYRELEELIDNQNKQLNQISKEIENIDFEYNDTDTKKHELEIENHKLISQNEQKVNEQSKLNANLNDINNEISKLGTDILSSFSIYKSVSNIHEVEEQIESAQSILDEIEKTQAILNSRYEEDIITDSPEDIRIRMSNLRFKLSVLTGDSKPKLLSDEQLDILESNLEDAKNDIDSVNEEIMNLRSKISAHYNIVKTPALLRNEIKAMKDEIIKMKEYHASTEIAASVLEEAGNEIRQTFAPELNMKTQRIFSHLTNGKYTDIIVSKNLEISTSEENNPSFREWRYLSTGTSEQAYLSLRLALADMITQNQIPLFLDDVFACYDDIRAEKGLKFLNEYSRLNQTLIFTCHKYADFKNKYIMFPSGN